MAAFAAAHADVPPEDRVGLAIALEDMRVLTQGARERSGDANPRALDNAELLEGLGLSPGHTSIALSSRLITDEVIEGARASLAREHGTSALELIDALPLPDVNVSYAEVMEQLLARFAEHDAPGSKAFAGMRGIARACDDYVNTREYVAERLAELGRAARVVEDEVTLIGDTLAPFYGTVMQHAHAHAHGHAHTVLYHTCISLLGLNMANGLELAHAREHGREPLRAPAPAPPFAAVPGVVSAVLVYAFAGLARSVLALTSTDGALAAGRVSKPLCKPTPNASVLAGKALLDAVMHVWRAVADVPYASETVALDARATLLPTVRALLYFADESGLCGLLPEGAVDALFEDVLRTGADTPEDGADADADAVATLDNWYDIWHDAHPLERDALPLGPNIREMARAVRERAVETLGDLWGWTRYVYDVVNNAAGAVEARVAAVDDVANAAAAHVMNTAAGAARAVESYVANNAGLLAGAAAATAGVVAAEVAAQAYYSDIVPAGTVLSAGLVGVVGWVTPLLIMRRTRLSVDYAQHAFFVADAVARITISVYIMRNPPSETQETRHLAPFMIHTVLAARNTFLFTCIHFVSSIYNVHARVNMLLMQERYAHDTDDNDFIATTKLRAFNSELDQVFTPRDMSTFFTQRNIRLWIKIAGAVTYTSVYAFLKNNPMMMHNAAIRDYAIPRQHQLFAAIQIQLGLRESLNLSPFAMPALQFACWALAALPNEPVSFEGLSSFLVMALIGANSYHCAMTAKIVDDKSYLCTQQSFTRFTTHLAITGYSVDCLAVAQAGLKIWDAYKVALHNKLFYMNAVNKDAVARLYGAQEERAGDLRVGIAWLPSVALLTLLLVMRQQGVQTAVIETVALTAARTVIVARPENSVPVADIANSLIADARSAQTSADMERIARDVYITLKKIPPMQGRDVMYLQKAGEFCLAAFQLANNTRDATQRLDSGDLSHITLLDQSYMLPRGTQTLSNNSDETARKSLMYYRAFTYLDQGAAGARA